MYGPDTLTDTRQNNVTGAGAPSDEELAGRVRRGCVRSYEELDHRFRPRLMFLLRKRTGSREDAEDLTQQALLRAYERIDQFDPKRSFRAWLFTIAIRLSVDVYRKNKIDTSGQDVELARDTSPGPAERLSAQDTQRRLWALADKVLDANQRTALWMHYGEQLKAKEIASALNMTAVHVRVLLYRARKTLMMHLEQAEASPPVTVIPEPVRIPTHQRSTMRRVPMPREGAMT